MISYRQRHPDRKVRLLLREISGNGNRYLRQNKWGRFRFVRGAAAHLMAKYDLPKQTFYRITRQLTEISREAARELRGDFQDMAGHGQTWAPMPKERLGNKSRGGSRKGRRKNNAAWKQPKPAEPERAALKAAVPLLEQLISGALDIWALTIDARRRIQDALWAAGIGQIDCAQTLSIYLDEALAA
jgi:hypothetical protein